MSFIRGKGRNDRIGRNTLGWVCAGWEERAGEVDVGVIMASDSGSIGWGMSPLGMAVGSTDSLALGILRSERSLGFGTSSKLEISSSDSASSLSVNLDAKWAIELVCSFIDGGGPRSVVDDVCKGSFAGSASFFVGDEGFANEGTFVEGLLSAGTSSGFSPA